MARIVLLADKEGGRPPDEVVDPSLPRVQVMRLTLLSEQAPGPVTMDLTGDLAVLKDQVFVLKEGADYRVRITFKVRRLAGLVGAWPGQPQGPNSLCAQVHKEIVSGLKCLHHTYRRGLCVDKATYMVGSYGPSAQEYEFVTPVEEAPRGVLARGHYAVTSVFTDDDRTDHLSWEWGLHISRPRGQGSESPSEEPLEDVPQEDGVLVLSGRTLGLALREHPALLVEFLDEELGLDLGDLSRFLVIHSMHLVTEFNSQTSPKIFAARILNHLLLFANQTLAAHRELLAGFKEAAPQFRGQVLFVVVDVAADNDHVLQYFGLKAEEAPTLRLVNVETTRKYAPTGRGPITTATVTAFCRAVLHGEVKPYLLSQEVPPDWDQRPLKTLVGKNFEQVAFDETKNVFVKFYAPWCTHCKEMAPVWEALAEKYRDHEDIIIAELDATANELDSLAVHGFPTLKYFPAGPGRKVIEYKSARDLETFSRFLDSGGELPAEQPTEEPTVPAAEPLANSTVEAKEEL
ncbi:Protein disulfide-isomerase A2 [Tupaia chinensis]|uniref:protein disulfide-isomerase n=1 Tax=Tupaia chinensis TaxID=246437 RepID=L9KYF5_TUPCH|nr:Protein disulfide-isomerase A2 [Tupaia chinensis]